MECKHVQQKLVDYSESLVDQKTHLLIEEHLQSCSECAQELKDFETTIHLLRSVPTQEPPETFWDDFTSNVMRKIEKANNAAPSRIKWFVPSFRMAVVAACVLVLLIGGGLAYSTGAIRKMFPAFFPSSNQLFVKSSEQSSLELTELSLNEIASEELVNDILESEFALLGRETVATFDVNSSDEIVHFLIENLNEEEKERLLKELYQMKE